MSLDENSYYLSQNENNMDNLSLPYSEDEIMERKSNVISLAKRILAQEVDYCTFELAFGENFLNVSDEKEEELLNMLADIYKNGRNSSFYGKLYELSVDAASFALYDCSYSDLY